MDDGALEEVGLLATQSAECRQNNQSCVGNQRGELDTVTKVGHGKEEEGAGKHEYDEWQEQDWAIKGGGFVILAFTLSGIMDEHGGPSVSRREIPGVPSLYVCKSPQKRENASCSPNCQ